jgi:N-methylhydantoinase A/oxoprolinase/acetone carboxylase beta subunit
MGFSLSEMWGNMGLPARMVFGILVVMGLASLTVFIERIITLRRSRKASRQFVSESGSHVREDMIDTVIDEVMATDVEAVAICLLFSFRNPEHEQRIAARLRCYLFLP